MPGLEPVVALELDRALALRVMEWEADMHRRIGRGDRTDVAYERPAGGHDQAIADDVRAWHMDRLRAEGRIH